MGWKTVSMAIGLIVYFIQFHSYIIYFLVLRDVFEEEHIEIL